ncbi:MAG TPA: isocitrate/isopropylmalate family dehydrogenase, partial [Gammaproteobacteria bacterium]|nr:isocitrate/isopropylmalate family dehydrogenase [Gammaproteobacteria bacterium]
PLATILSVAMLLRYSLHESEMAARVEGAVNKVLDSGIRTADIHSAGTEQVGTGRMGDAIVAALRED